MALGGLLDLEIDGFGPKVRIRLGGGADNAVADVFFHQAQADGVQGLGHGGDLGEDVDAVLVLVDHPGDAADLALDPLEPAQVGVLVGGVAVLGGFSYRFFVGHGGRPSFGSLHALKVYP